MSKKRKVSWQEAKKEAQRIIEMNGGDYTPCCVEHIWKKVQYCLERGRDPSKDEGVLLTGNCNPMG